jgi:glycosyltransferase involved in cell wall biosynthesis
LVYRSVDRAFYVGTANKRYFLWAGLMENQLTFAPHAVDNGYFMRDNEERMTQAAVKRKELGITKEATVFIFVGKLEAKKQPNMLAEAFNEAKLTNSHLLFIGSGALEAELKDQYAAVDHIHFVGFQNQQSMPMWYRVGNVLCLPSKGPGETWGLAVNEAMASGCAAIVSNRTGCNEDVVSSDTVGIQFSADCSNDLSASLRYASERAWDRNAIQSHISFWSHTELIKAIRLELNKVN